MSDEYPAYPSIPRLFRDVTITEKIDGTNALVSVSESGVVRAGSRNRWLTPDADNFGFARWVQEHADELRALGPGNHHGEWWGQGIQRGYGLTEKRFSLFNAVRWCAHDAEPRAISNPNPKAPIKFQERVPECCHVVPVLYRGVFTDDWVTMELDDLIRNGSRAAPGFMKPEGIVIFHKASQSLFKVTLDGDGHKGARNRGG